MLGCQKVIEYQIQTFVYFDILSTSRKKVAKTLKLGVAKEYKLNLFGAY